MPRILIADDHPDIVRLAQIILQREGWEVLAAADGRQALDKALTELPDLIILDIMMPEMDGMEVMRQLGYHRETCRIPVIMLTAKSDYQDVSTARQSGVKEYLVKPIDPKKLVAAVRKALRLPAAA